MDEVYFKKVFEKYNKRLILYATKYVGELFASDIVQDTFVRLWNKRDDFKLPIDVVIKTWLYNSIQNDCFKILKINKWGYKEREVVRHISNQYHTIIPKDVSLSLSRQENHEHTDSLVIRTELLSEIAEMREKLSPSKKKVFDLLFVQQLSLEKVKETLNLTVTNMSAKKMQIIREFKLFGEYVLDKKYWTKKVEGNTVKYLLKTECIKRAHQYSENK